MANEENKEPARPDLIAALDEIAVEDIQSFLVEVTRHSNCPTCGTNSWEVLDPKAGNYFVTQLAQDGTYNFPPSGMPVAAVVCQKCYYVRYHALGGILNWKRAKTTAPAVPAGRTVHE